LPVTKLLIPYRRVELEVSYCCCDDTEMPASGQDNVVSISMSGVFSATSCSFVYGYRRFGGTCCLRIGREICFFSISDASMLIGKRACSVWV
jgi:hypothetical protein